MNQFDNVIERYEVTGRYLIPVPESDGKETTSDNIKDIEVNLLLNGCEQYGYNGIYERNVIITLESVTYRYYKYTSEADIIIKKWVDENYNHLSKEFKRHIQWVKYVKRKKIDLKNYYNCID